jgi:hypothetical protein
MVLHKHMWGRGRAHYGTPWGFSDAWMPQREVVVREVDRYPVQPYRGGSKDAMLIGGAVALGVVALVAIVYGAAKK